MQINQMRVLLSGATGGIGRELARQLAASGAQIIALGRDANGLERLLRSLTPHAEHPHVRFPVDLCDDAQRQALIDALESRQLTPNVLINLAGTNQFRLFEAQDPTALRAMIDTNLTATLLLTQGVLPLLRRRSQARILNVGSTFGSIGYPGYVGYSTTKFALRGFSEALQRELADSPIRVQYCAPRATRTGLNSPEADELNQHLNNGVDDPARVARALLAQLASGETNRYLGWPEKLFVRVNSLWPALVSGAIAKQLPVIKRYAARIETPTPDPKT